MRIDNAVGAPNEEPIFWLALTDYIDANADFAYISEMPGFRPKNPDFETAVRKLFLLVPLAGTLGVELESILPGQVTCSMPLRPDLSQQNGFAHAGVLTSLADFACGLAAYSLMPADHNVLSINLNISLMRPAAGERLRAVGRVIRAGRTAYFTEAEIISLSAESEIVAARMTGTMMAVKAGG